MDTDCHETGNNCNRETIIPDDGILMSIKTEPEVVVEQYEKSAVWNKKVIQEACEESIFTSIDAETNDESQQKINDKLQNWHETPTKLMLSLIEELRPKLGKSMYVKTKSKMYKVISDKMADEGYAYTPLQIENKFRGLERTYKKTVSHDRLTGRNRHTCPYQNELGRILREKRGINPEFLLDSENVEGISRSQIIDGVALDMDTSSKGDELSQNNNFRKSKVGMRDQVLAKIEEISREKKEFHSKVLELMKKKDERAQKKEERSQRKLELLEMLVNQRKQ